MTPWQYVNKNLKRYIVRTLYILCIYWLSIFLSLFYNEHSTHAWEIMLPKKECFSWRDIFPFFVLLRLTKKWLLLQYVWFFFERNLLSCVDFYLTHSLEDSLYPLFFLLFLNERMCGQIWWIYDTLILKPNLKANDIKKPEDQSYCGYSDRPSSRSVKINRST